MIEKLLTQDTLRVRVHAKDWEEAVRKAGELLYLNGAVEPQYIDKMVEIVKEIGPYIVILKGVALAHARPEDGARRIGLSLITLDEPVYFVNEDNDPVNIVFGLSAVDNSSHLDLIAEMGAIFDDKKALQEIAESVDETEVLGIIRRLTEKLKD